MWRGQVGNQAAGFLIGHHWAWALKQACVHHLPRGQIRWDEAVLLRATACVFCLRWTPETEQSASFCRRFPLEICGVFLWQPTASEAHHLHPEDAEQTRAVSRRQSRAENGAAALLFHFGSQGRCWLTAALPRSVCLWVKWRTNYKSLMMYLFREADRDFSFVMSSKLPNPCVNRVSSCL